MIYSRARSERNGATVAKRDTVRGMRIVEEPPALRHFTAKFEEI